MSGEAVQGGNRGESLRAELTALERMGLRYAVLAAWAQDLRGAGTALPSDVGSRLESARIKLSSGCYSSCDVGCDLGAVEGTLTAADATAGGRGVSFWLELLARAMDPKASVAGLLTIPAVRVYYQGCGFGPCGCSS